jgi:hypothetical protein
MKKLLSDRKPDTPAEPSKPPKFTPRGSSNKNRILIAVKDGRIDFDAMGQESAKAFNELMHNPDVQAQFGIGPLRDHFDPEQCKEFYEGIGLILMGFGKFMFKWPDPAIAKLAYTEEEKEKLSKPTAKVLDEFAPKWLRENQSVAALLVVFGTMTRNKLHEAALLAFQIKKANAPPAPAPITSAVPNVVTVPSGVEAPSRKPINPGPNLGGNGGPEL